MNWIACSSSQLRINCIWQAMRWVRIITAYGAYAGGEVGEQVVLRSLIGGRFEGEIVNTMMVGNYPASVPEISGRRWIYSSE